MRFVITCPPNGSVLFARWRVSSSVVCRRRLSSSVTLPVCGWQPGSLEVGQPTLHGWPVVLRPVSFRATPCFKSRTSNWEITYYSI